jgi:hypothetical protein
VSDEQVESVNAALEAQRQALGGTLVGQLKPRDSYFSHGQDGFRMALEAIAEDPATEARAPGSREVLMALAETIWEWADDLDLEISGDQPEQAGDAKMFDLLDRLRQVPGVCPLEHEGEDE